MLSPALLILAIARFARRVAGLLSSLVKGAAGSAFAGFGASAILVLGGVDPDGKRRQLDSGARKLDMGQPQDGGVYQHRECNGQGDAPDGAVQGCNHGT